MGIDVDGGLIVGCAYSDLDQDFIDQQEELSDDWIYDLDMTSLSPYYDSPMEEWYIGFSLGDELLIDDKDEWVTTIKEFAAKFKEVTGNDAYLIGMQDIT